jgi:hypothetical protein
VIVTPPGTFILAGRVREPGAGSLSGVTVRHVASGDSVTTGNDGRYSLAGVANPPRLALTKPDYESVDLMAFANVFLEPPMQRIIRMTPESTISRTLAPNDMEYAVSANGEPCQPCRLVRMTSATAGTIRVRVTWDDTDAAINIWVNDQIFRGDSTKQETIADIVVAAGETIFYYGRLPGTTRLSRHTGVTLTAGAVSASL